MIWIHSRQPAHQYPIVHRRREATARFFEKELGVMEGAGQSQQIAALDEVGDCADDEGRLGGHWEQTINQQDIN